MRRNIVDIQTTLSAVYIHRDTIYNFRYYISFSSTECHKSSGVTTQDNSRVLPILELWLKHFFFFFNITYCIPM